MNIFVLDLDPWTSAQMHCDKHVPKMCVEAAQMATSAVLHYEPFAYMHGIWPMTKKRTPYKGGYPNHPCTRWGQASRSNYDWLITYGLALCLEYQKRFGKVHACKQALMILQNYRTSIPAGELTPFAQAMPDEHKHSDPVTAYRSYYRTKSFATWNKGTPAPAWW